MLSSVLNSQISYVYDSKDKHNASIIRTWRTKSNGKNKEILIYARSLWRKIFPENSNPQKNSEFTPKSKNSPQKVYPYSENSPRKVCELGRNSPRKVLIHSITAYWLGDYNVGRNGPILTLPFYMAFLLREV